MEQWRRQLYENELMHYGVKGMKWGKHLKAKDLVDLYRKRISGEHYLNDRSQIKSTPGRFNSSTKFSTYNNGKYTKNYEDHKMDAYQRLTNAKYDREYAAKRGQSGKLINRMESAAYRTMATRGNIAGRHSENRAMQIKQTYYKKSLAGIAESSVKKGKKLYASLIKKNKTNIHPSQPASNKSTVRTWANKKLKKAHDRIDKYVTKRQEKRIRVTYSDPIIHR